MRACCRETNCSTPNACAFPNAWHCHSVLRQKLAVTEIPVATVSATFKKHSFSYWIYGVDSKVFETEYRT